MLCEICDGEDAVVEYVFTKDNKKINICNNCVKVLTDEYKGRKYRSFSSNVYTERPKKLIKNRGV